MNATKPATIAARKPSAAATSARKNGKPAATKAGCTPPTSRAGRKLSRKPAKSVRPDKARMVKQLARSFNLNGALVHVITRWHAVRVDLPGILEDPANPGTWVSQQVVTEFGESFTPKPIDDILDELMAGG